MFTAICLITGSLWGKPMWGTWWVWDARLTSVLVLFFLYLGHIALTAAFDEPDRAARPAAILALIGAVNLPIIKFSVEWWNTLHQPASVTRLDAPAIHMDILWPLLVAAAGFLFAFASLVLLRMRTAILERRARADARAGGRGASARGHAGMSAFLDMGATRPSSGRPTRSRSARWSRSRPSRCGSGARPGPRWRGSRLLGPRRRGGGSA